MSEIKKLPEVMILAKHSIGDGTLTQWQLHTLEFVEADNEQFEFETDAVRAMPDVEQAYIIPSAMLGYIDPRFWMPWAAEIPKEAVN